MVDAPYKSVKKALDLLSIILFEDKSGNGITLTELSERMGMPANSTRNTLKSIIAGGFLEQTDKGLYIPGPKSRSLMRGRVFSGSMQMNIERALKKFSESSGECMIFVILVNGKRHLVAESIPDTPVRVDTRLFNNSNPFEVVSGHLLLAYAEKEQLLESIQKFKMLGNAWQGIDNMAALEQELEKIREKGYCMTATQNSKVRVFVNPVFGGNNEFAGAIACITPQYTVSDSDIAAMQNEMKGNAKKLGKIIAKGEVT